MRLTIFRHQDVEVLQSIRQSIDPNTIASSIFLRTWDFEIDPCESPGTRFLGILCSFPGGNSSNRVIEINLEADGLEGFLSPILGNLRELTLLNLSKNKFRGPIPESIVNATKITRLMLQENYLSGDIPPGLKNLKGLEILDLSRNRLSGPIPVGISSLRSLTYLSLSNNELAGRIPDMTGLWQLEKLDLSNNELSGNLPELPSSLRAVFLGQNLLYGHIATIDRLQRVVQLHLSGNRFTGLVNQGVLVLPVVRHIDLSSNRFTEMEVKKMTSKRTQLEVLELQKNRISGRLPLNLITYKNLSSVNLGHNLFSGEIPTEYGERVEKGYWRSLYLDNNLLEGSVPAGLVNSTVSGSLARNCITCNRGIPMCRGGQKPASDCIGRG
ncbi:probable LRR receptor-like serine/threonine-protein kinase At4g36180 [Andrographis paniculata]|uniref:probable LRR receptor-like serine/threonine-protein kinase At4g36180 n=1 Tax=Andrographis paniculata TaxID=175694 RepID=UPI0021E8310E|nr:probable LRR receptor-like serine/threonine-protein kinase At4g36180 [Andrographis paniculata]XP_051118268.1 probable LRR receptor-like serine/threonine-protein kinase At4g36180 [Andrographis paniculata]